MEKDVLQLAELAKHMMLDGVCPWSDRQDFDSILSHILQECQELSDAVHGGESVKEVTSEAGDVLMLALLLCYKMEALGMTSMSAIINEAFDKILRRSPHVFEKHPTVSYEEAEEIWKLAKLAEKNAN